MRTFAINGLGRIGRLVLREYVARKPSNIKLIGINDLTDIDTLVYLTKYDSVHGRCRDDVTSNENSIMIGQHNIPIFNYKTPDNIPWSESGVDWVLETSGRFTKREDAALHLKAGAKKVLIGAPADSADFCTIFGVNHMNYNSGSQHIISCGSCTTNSLAPPMQVLHSQFGIENASATTIHAYTSSQAVVDIASAKRIRGRAAALNLIPTSTGADKVIGSVFPDLKGKFSALAVRAPIADGGLTDLTIRLKTGVSLDFLHQTLINACHNELKNVMDFTLEEWVSSDIIGNPHSAVIHGLSTRLIDEKTVKLQVWYDNEYAYACRMLDLLQHLPD